MSQNEQMKGMEKSLLMHTVFAGSFGSFSMIVYGYFPSSLQTSDFRSTKKILSQYASMSLFLCHCTILSVRCMYPQIEDRDHFREVSKISRRPGGGNPIIHKIIRKPNTYCYSSTTGGGLYKRWDQNFYFSKTMIFVSIMMVGHK